MMKTPWFILCWGCCLLQSALILGVEPVWNVRNNIPREKVIVQAHRGFGHFGPEGSNDSFERAWQLGLVPEADLRLTKDKQIVSFHDNDFRRILPDASDSVKSKGVADLTLEEVKKLDVGAFRGEQFKGQQALSLADIVDILKANRLRLVYLDIKNVDFEQLAAETVGAHSQMIVASSKYSELLAWKKVAPLSLTLHWMGAPEAKLRERLDELKKVNFAGIDQLQIHVNTDQSGIFSPSESFLKETGECLQRHGVLFQVLFWGEAGSHAKNYWRLMDLGCVSFATDYPQVTKSAIDEYYSKGNIIPE